MTFENDNYPFSVHVINQEVTFFQPAREKRSSDVLAAAIDTLLVDSPESIRTQALGGKGNYPGLSITRTEWKKIVHKEPWIQVVAATLGVSMDQVLGE